MPNESGVNVCPNPKCLRRIGDPILLNDLSTTPAEQYYACPHCFIKLEEIPTHHKKQEGKNEKEEEFLVETPEKKEKGPSRCAGYFGYLACLPENHPIPQECVICPKVLDCAMKNK